MKEIGPSFADALRRLAREMDSESPPPAIEASLRSELQLRKHPSQPTGFKRWWIAGALAASLAAGALIWRLEPRRPLAPEQPGLPARLSPAPAPMEVSPEPQVTGPRRRPLPRPRREVATQFLAVHRGNPALEPGSRIVRVRLPRQVMLAFGFPVNQDRLLETIQADVVLDQDGTAQAVRFVQ